MNDGFTKLVSTIIGSSIWSEDDKTRILWITMLALCDADGFVSGTVPGLAAMARMKIPQVQSSLAKLEAPDADSRTKDNEGRRVIPIEGGWIVLNYAKYRDRDRAEKRKEYLRNYQRDYMRTVRQEKSNESLTNVQPSASASASTSVVKSDVSDFESFWKSYPRKVGKKAALKAWINAKDKPVLDAVINSIEQHKRSDQWRKDGGQYIPNPATWINQGRWDDEAVVTAKSARRETAAAKQADKDRLVADFMEQIVERCQARDDAIRFVDNVHKSLNDVVAEGQIMDFWIAANSMSENKRRS